MTIKPWREIAAPHSDVLAGKFQQAEFAADLSRVHAGTANEEYQNPALFFQRTYITEGMRLLLDSVVKRLAGQGGDPVIQLQTAFGGGKTHTMLAIYHLAKGEVSSSELPGVSPILDAAGIHDLPKARVAVLDGIQASPNQAAVRHGQRIHTLWGDLAWQLGGADGYAMVQEADVSGTSPGKDVLAQLLARYAPCVVLMDELVAYIRQFEEGKALLGGTFDSNLSFIQALTEAMKAVPNAVLLASLPESVKEVGSQRGEKALASLSHYFGRVQALWKPVASNEAFEIVRRRLFTEISDPRAAEMVCRSYANFYLEHRDSFPRETQEASYRERLVQAYPIHPEVFDRLYGDWSTLDNFQRTRGVLKLMAKVIHALWKEGNNDALILPGSFPLFDSDTRNELVQYLAPGWDPVVEKEVDGPRSEPWSIENLEPRFGSVQACRRVSRTIFLGSAPMLQTPGVRGLERDRILLGVAQPGQSIPVYEDALKRLGDRLHHLNTAGNRYWLDTRPNLRREMEDRKRRFDDRDHIVPLIKERVQRQASNGIFGGVHIFTPSGDVPDDWALRLVILPPDASYSRSGVSTARERATEIVKKRGEQPRFRQNRLLFLAANSDTVSRLKDHVRSYLAWKSIVEDYKSAHLVLDNLMARQAENDLKQAEDTVTRLIRETYTWLLAPLQEVVAGRGISEIQWEAFPLNTGASGFVNEVERVLKENELVISEWAPIHLAKELQAWFWKDGRAHVGAQEFWQQSCQQLYLPRLKNEQVLQSTIAAGTGSRDFFGVAQGVEGSADEPRYLGFSYGQRCNPTLDSSLLVIQASAAAAYEERTRPAPAPIEPPATLAAPQAYASISAPTSASASVSASAPVNYARSSAEPVGTPPVAAARGPRKTRFYGSVELDRVNALREFTTIMDEVLQHFTANLAVGVKLSIEVEANYPEGFDEGTQRTVRENTRSLKFNAAEFEEE